MIGIYKITNTENGKCYIGSSMNISNRWNQHKIDLNRKNHHSIKLQRSFNKYGEEKFKYEIVEEVSIEELLIREQFYINFFDSYNNGYNSVPTAGNNMGMIHSEETKNILRECSVGNKNMLGKKHTEETKNIIREKLKGRSLSEETKEKMRNRIISEETKEKLRNRIPWNKGKKTSLETRKKLSESHIGKKQSQEVIDNRVKLNTGQKRSEEVKKKMSESMIGVKKRPMSEENKTFRSKKILMIYQDGTTKQFDSVGKCAKYIKTCSSRISEVLTGKKESYKKYKFKYI